MNPDFSNYCVSLFCTSFAKKRIELQVNNTIRKRFNNPPIYWIISKDFNRLDSGVSKKEGYDLLGAQR